MESFYDKANARRKVAIKTAGLGGDWVEDLGDVRAYMASQARGRDVDFRTPFYAGARREDIIAMWDSIYDNESYILDGELRKYEASERSKIGPTSIAVPYAERVEGVNHYYNAPALFPDSIKMPEFSQALEMVRRLEPSASLSRKGLVDSVESLPKSTNWGLPFFEKGSVSWSRYAKRAAELQKLINRGEPINIDMLPPSVIGWRGAANGLNQPSKSRVIWIYPHEISILERQFQLPLLTRLKRHNAFSAWISDDRVDSQVGVLLREAHRDAKVLLSFDASRFDTTITGAFNTAIFDIIASWFQPKDRENIVFLSRYFNMSSLMVPSGTSGLWSIKTGRTGSVPSGSTFTNLVDSLANLVLSSYVKLRMGEDLRTVEYDLHNKVQVQGDDALWLFNNFEDSDSKGAIVAAEQYVAELGLMANPDKQYSVPGYASYLRNLHSVDSIGGVRSTYRILSGLTGYERFKPNRDTREDSIRWIMQLNNCRHHPLFRLLINFVIKGDTTNALGTKESYGISKLFAGDLEYFVNRLDLQSFGTGREMLLGWRRLSVVRILRQIQSDNGFRDDF